MKKICTNKFFCIFLIIILIIFLFYIFLDTNSPEIMRKLPISGGVWSLCKTPKLNIENFQDTPKSGSAWTTSSADKQAAENTTQADKDLQNTITNIVNSQLEKIKTTQGAFIKGPPGPPGQQGPAGSKLIASGKLINKANSFDSNSGSSSNSMPNYFMPQYVLTRTGGTDSFSTVSYMDNNSAFASFQDWQFNIDNNIISRYDGKCLTMDDPKKNALNSVLYLDKCEPTNSYQKWKWDNVSNRLLSMNNDINSNKVKCIVSTDPSGNNVNISNNLNCTGDECTKSKTIKKIAEVNDCDINIVKDKEVWSFI
jgi:hypothetical protein